MITQSNTGHGHVVPRADGVKMRCGGPALCSTCQAEKRTLEAQFATLSPAHIEDGEEVEVVAWADPSDLNLMRRHGHTSCVVKAAQDPCCSEPLMTVAQHQRIVAALSAPPAAGVPKGWREDVSLAAQMLTWGDDDGGLTERQIREIEQHAKKLFAMLAAPTPPASERQREVVMPERKPFPDPGRYSSTPDLWPQRCAEVKGWNDCLTEFLRLNPHLAKGEGV